MLSPIFLIREYQHALVKAGKYVEITMYVNEALCGGLNLPD